MRLPQQSSIEREDCRQQEKSNAYLDAIWLDRNESTKNCKLHRKSINSFKSYVCSLDMASAFSRSALALLL